MQTTQKPHYLGHRKRIKEKFINSNPKSFLDYELLEILLFSSYTRQDTKIIAKNILKEFSNLNELINAPIESLQNNEFINNNSLIQIKIIKEIIDRSLLDNIKQGNILDSWEKILDYYKISYSNMSIEEFRVLFLNKKYELIDDYKIVGSEDRVLLNMEEIVKKAIIKNARSVFLSHNHPSNKIDPSKNDILATEKLRKALKIVNIGLKDHIIFGTKGDYYSFKENGLI